MSRLFLKLQFFGLLVAYTYLGLRPFHGGLLPISYGDLVLHFGGYATLFISARLAFGARPDVRVLLALLFGYSVLIEVTQHFLPTRRLEALDLLANALGLLTGCAFYTIVARGFDRRWGRS